MFFPLHICFLQSYKIYLCILKTPLLLTLTMLPGVCALSHCSFIFALVYISFSLLLHLLSSFIVVWRKVSMGACVSLLEMCLQCQYLVWENILLNFDIQQKLLHRCYRVAEELLLLCFAICFCCFFLAKIKFHIICGLLQYSSYLNNNNGHLKTTAVQTLYNRGERERGWEGERVSG